LDYDSPAKLNLVAATTERPHIIWEGHNQEMSGHISPKSTYLTIFGALMVCTILTVIAAFINLGDLNFPVALTIAVFKATLVVLFFMHVKYGSKLTKLIVGTAFFFLGILLTLTLSDYLSRGWFTSPRGSTSAAAITSVTGPLTTGARPLEPAPQNTSPK
jgi:cytochrome c oxidase subunit IV